jgi:hypothetical protein
MRKTALLSGVAGLFLMTAPAFAQDGTAPQTTPPATPPGQAESPSLTLEAGAIVRGSDGQLGVLVGSRMNGARQQITVRGEDGLVRAVPIDGIRQDGDAVVVDFTLEQFAAADTVTQPAVPATPAEPGVTPATPATPAVPGERTPPAQDDDDVADDVDDSTDEGATPATPAVPAVPADPGDNPAVRATPAVPATPPAHSAAPRPGEGANPGQGQGQGKPRT